MTTQDNTFYYTDTHPKRPIIKFRPTTYVEPHLMPAPSQTPWNSCTMPWVNAGVSYPRVMEFNAETPHCSTQQQQHLDDFLTQRPIVKRKASIEPIIPVKQHITEEKMAEHLSGLHISNDYKSHTKQKSSQLLTSIEDTLDNGLFNSNTITTKTTATKLNQQYMVNMTPQDLEEKLKNAQRITVCEQIRQLTNDPLLPMALMDRIEKPCTALMLWQPPPQQLRDLITRHGGSNTPSEIYKVDDEGGESDDKNNNDQMMDMNPDSSGMDLDL